MAENDSSAPELRREPFWAGPSRRRATPIALGGARWRPIGFGSLEWVEGG